MSLKLAVRPFKWGIDQTFILTQPTVTLGWLATLRVSRLMHTTVLGSKLYSIQDKCRWNVSTRRQLFGNFLLVQSLTRSSKNNQTSPVLLMWHKYSCWPEKKYQTLWYILQLLMRCAWVQDLVGFWLRVTLSRLIWCKDRKASENP